MSSLVTSSTTNASDHVAAAPKEDAAATPAASVRYTGVPAIGVLVPEFPSQTHVFFWREIVAWRQAGLSVDLLSTRRPPDDACRHAFADEARQQTHYLWPPRARDTVAGTILSPGKLAKALGYVRSLSEASLRQKAKVTAMIGSAVDLLAYCRDRNVGHVHCHSFADAAHVCRIAQLLGGPTYSLTLHGDLPVYGTDHKKKLAGCSAVGCDGPHLVGQVVSLGYPEERVLPNWMGVDTAQFTARDPDPTTGRLRLITVARLNVNKGHRFALRAMKKLVDAGRDATYTLVGLGEYEGEIRKEVQRLGLGERVRLTGTLGEDEVRRELTEHDAFCLPSVGLGEAGPISVMEAMACGLPVVASRIGATPQMIEHGRTGYLCDQEDVEALSAAFFSLADDAEVRAIIGTDARQFAEEHFDSKRTSLRLFEHIRYWTPQTFTA
jgi:glycosyltransferase involved in cell wall biosynthesis